MLRSIWRGIRVNLVVLPDIDCPERCPKSPKKSSSKLFLPNFLRLLSSFFPSTLQPTVRNVKHGSEVCLSLACWQLLVRSVKHDCGVSWWVQIPFYLLLGSQASNKSSSEVFHRETVPYFPVTQKVLTEGQVAWIANVDCVDVLLTLPTACSELMKYELQVINQKFLKV